MIGLSRNGQTLTGWALYQQHVIDVLSTPVGSRIKRRKYGSKIPILLGKTLSAHVMTLAQVYAIEAFYSQYNNINKYVLLDAQAQRAPNGIKIILSFDMGVIEHVVSGTK